MTTPETTTTEQVEAPIAYIYDDDGYYFMCKHKQQSPRIKGKFLTPANSTEIKPEIPEGYFGHWNGSEWEYEKIPTSAEEFVGVQVSHKSQTARNRLLRELLQSLVNQDSQHYRVIRGSEEEGLWWSVERIPEKTVEELRVQKMSQLDSAFKSWYQEGATVTSSLGFVADSDARAMMDVSGLVTTLEAQPVESRATVAFMDANNQAHLLTLEQLKTVQVEIIQNGQSAYQQKWALRTAIESAQTKEELEAIEIKFTAEDFNK